MRKQRHGKQKHCVRSYWVSSWWSQIWTLADSRVHLPMDEVNVLGEIREGPGIFIIRVTSPRSRGECRNSAEHQGSWKLSVGHEGTPLVLPSEMDSTLVTSSTNPMMATWSWHLGRCGVSKETGSCWYGWHRARIWHIRFENNHSTHVQKEGSQLPFKEHLSSARPHPAVRFIYIISDSHKTPLGSVVLSLCCWWRDWGSESISDLPKITQPDNSSAGSWTQLWPTSKPFSSTALLPSVSYPFPHIHPSFTFTTYCLPGSGLSALCTCWSAHFCLGRGGSAETVFLASHLRPSEVVSHTAVLGTSRQLFLGFSKLSVLIAGKTRKQRRLK